MTIMVVLISLGNEVFKCLNFDKKIGALVISNDEGAKILHCFMQIKKWRTCISSFLRRR